MDEPESDASGLLDEIMSTYVLPLFPAFHHAAELPTAESGFAGISSFFGSELRGCVGVLATLDALHALYDGPVDAIDPSDYVGELANMAAGRVKRGLFAKGIEATLTPPVVMQGVELRMHATELVRTFTLRHNSCLLHVWIDLMRLPQLGSADAATAEGEEYLEPGAFALF